MYIVIYIYTQYKYIYICLYTSAYVRFLWGTVISSVLWRIAGFQHRYRDITPRIAVHFPAFRCISLVCSDILQYEEIHIAKVPPTILPYETPIEEVQSSLTLLYAFSHCQYSMDRGIFWDHNRTEVTGMPL